MSLEVDMTSNAGGGKANCLFFGEPVWLGNPDPGSVCSMGMAASVIKDCLVTPSINYGVFFPLKCRDFKVMAMFFFHKLGVFFH